MSEFEIGYGKPPKHTRFKPGQSGNPKGRPKGKRNFATDVKATLKTPVKVMRDGRSRKVSTQEAALLRLREKALSGDQRALDRLLVLAQTYGEDEAVAAVSMSTSDEMLLQVYRARLLSGAAALPHPREEADEVTKPNRPADLDTTGQRPMNLKRIRPKNFRDSDDR